MQPLLVQIWLTCVVAQVDVLPPVVLQNPLLCPGIILVSHILIVCPRRGVQDLFYDEHENGQASQYSQKLWADCHSSKGSRMCCGGRDLRLLQVVICIYWFAC